MTVEELSTLVLEALDRHGWVEVDGLGVFSKNPLGQIQFHGGNAPRVFIAYAIEDLEAAERLYFDLRWLGFSPWMDRHKLLPGQNWPRRIEEAIAGCDYFVACFSTNSVRKRGGFQTEVRFALDCAKKMPLDDVFLVPLRLNECPMPARIQRETQYLDMFPDWNTGLARLHAIIHRK